MDVRVIVQALYYISRKLNRKIDKVSAIKLLFFADRYHLRKYFKSITEDVYYAMEMGPVASGVKELISPNGYSDLDKNEKGYFDSYLRMVDVYTYEAVKIDKDLNMLSETEIEALDFAIDNFGDKTYAQLINLTHKYPEWQKYREIIKKGYKRELIQNEDFFEPSKIDGDPFDCISEDIVESSKSIVMDN